MAERIVFYTNGVGTSVDPCRKMNLDSYIPSCIFHHVNINWKCIIELNIKIQNIKPQEENRSNLCNL